MEEKKKKSVVKIIINIVIWVILFAWLIICVIDFNKTHKRQKPIFTFKSETVKYEDGEVDSYLGLGYRVFHYKRKCFDGVEFGPFWFKDKSIESETCSN